MIRNIALLAPLALMACQPQAPAPAVSDAELSVQCVTMLSLHANELRKTSPAVDDGALKAAIAAYRAQAATEFTPDELAQFIASNVAVFDDTPADKLAAEAETCLKSAPAAR